MKRIWKVIGNRWVISLIGLCALAMLIWILGPLFAFAGREPLATELARSLAIVTLVAVWALIQVQRYLRSRRANAQMLDEVAAAAGTSAAAPGQLESEEEVAALRERFDKAAAVLRKTRLGNKRQQGQYLYQLPWYMIIGPPGCGKTTALVNSGLQFPLADQFGMKAIQGVGGTRNCDWWFTNEAVLLDTAGRYTTQDSYQEVDSAAWQGFLELLKKHRRRRPINGVLVAVSLADLVGQSELERSEHARAIRQRIQELHERFRIRFPIYVLLTKADLIAGFMEFFSDQGHEERRQVLGMTFPLEGDDEGEPAISHFISEFNDLEGSLNNRLVSRLEQERDSRRRCTIYAFPKQFSSVRDIVDRFLDDAFQPSRFEERPMIRGVYFTSGTQEGSPIDRLLGTMAAAFGLDRTQAPAFSGKGRSYFINRLLVDVVFGESGLAGLNRRLERQRNWVQRGAYAGALALTALAATAWFVSYGRNLNYIQEVATQTEEATQLIDDVSVADTDSYFAIPSLELVRGIPGGYDSRDLSPPWLSGLGLYQGDKLGSEAQAAYRRLLHNMFLPRLVLRLEEMLSQQGASPDYLYEALKVYLMLADPEHFDADTVKAWLALDWEVRLTGDQNSPLREALLSHLDALLADLPDPPAINIDTDLRDGVRAQLLRLPMAERTYDRIKRTNIKGPQPPFRIIDATGAEGKRVFARKSGKPLDEGIPGLYTRDGYAKVFLPENMSLAKHLAGERWIFGPEFALDEQATDVFKLSCQVRELYFTDYVREWTELLEDLRIVRFNNLQHAVEVLNIVSGPTSPVRRLLAAVDRETTLESVLDPAKVSVPETSGRLSRMTDRLAKLIEVERQVQKQISSCEADRLVEREFEALRRQVQPLGDSPPGIEATLSTLNELYVHMSSILRSGDRGKRALDLARDEALGTTSIVDRLKLDAGRQPAPLNELLGSLAKRVSGLNTGNVRSHLNSVWRGKVLPFYERSISGRYPLDRNSSRETTLEDFGRFFGPGGFLEDFFKTHLKEFVDTSGRTWRWNPSGRRTLGVSSRILVQLQRAAAIREAFFRDSETMPSVRFSLKPIYMDTSISQFHMTLDDQTVSYNHGPPRWSNLQWPGPGGSSQVQIMLSPVSTVTRSTLALDGPWAWFRLIDDSGVKSTSTPERLRVTIDVGGRKARFVLRASSALNPFLLRELQEFQCPSRL